MAAKALFFLGALLLLQGAFAGVIISELLAHTDLPEVDWIEFHNQGTDPVDMAGWWLSDNAAKLTAFQFPAGWSLAPGQYRSLRATVFDPSNYPVNGFRFSSVGESAFLTPGATPTVPEDSISFPASRNGLSFIRHKGEDGRVTFPSAAVRTEGARNSYPLTGPNAGVAITEINYAPANGIPAFVKLTNMKPNQLQMFDPAYPENKYQVSGLWAGCTPPNAFNVPASTVLATGRSLYITTADAATFRAAVVTANAADTIVTLANLSFSPSGGSVGVWSPDVPNFSNTSVLIEVPYYFLDLVEFTNAAPWPVLNAGDYLVKVAPVSYGNDATKWRASSASVLTCTQNDVSTCPFMDDCTVASCSAADTCVYKLRTCAMAATQADADKAQACFPPPPPARCELPVPIALTPYDAASLLSVSVAAVAVAIVAALAL